MEISTFVLPKQGKGKYFTETLRIMRLTAVLLLAFAVHISARGVSQSISITLKDASLEKALDLIATQSKYNFVYTGTQIKNANRVSVTLSNVGIAYALERIFQDQPLTYKINEDLKQVIILEKAAAGPSVLLQVNTETTRPIKGIILDENGAPLPGVNVLVKGTENGTTTNAQGEFVLENINNSSTLIVSHVGYEVLEVKAGERLSLKLSLHIKSGTLAEIGVSPSTGYQTLPKERATGSFDFVDNKLFNRAVSTDVLSRLNGVASGLVIDNSVNNSIHLQIRGLSTIQSNTTPLIIVNNFPYDGDLESINPNDVESITILKDASAASIWGVRAGNGVVVITTKGGRQNQPLHVEINTNLSISSKANLYYDPNFLDAGDFISVEQQLFATGFYSSQIGSRRKYPLSPVVDLLNQEQLGLISSTDATNQINQYKLLDVRNDENKYFYRSQVNQQYNLNMSGGSDRTAYYFSAGLDKDALGPVGSSYQRITVNSNTTFTPLKGMKISSNLNYVENISRADNTLGQLQTGGPNGLGLYPYAQLASSSGKPLPIVKDYSTEYVNAAPSMGFLNWQFTPLAELQDGLNTNKSSATDIRANVDINYSILKGLAVGATFQYEHIHSNSTNDAKSSSYYTRNLINKFAVLSNNAISTYVVPLGDIIDYGFNDIVSQNFRPYLSFNRELNKFQINSIAGFEVKDYDSKNYGYRIYGFDPNSSTFLPADYTQSYLTHPSGIGSFPSGLVNTENINRFRSYFGNANLTYLNKYSLSGSGRIDQSNIFGVNTNLKTVPLWSVGGKWDISKESFFHPGWVNELSARVTYGYSGNINASLSAYPTANYSTLPGPYGIYPYANLISAGNPDLTWEKSGMLNFGLDFSIWRHRLAGSIEYYERRGTDLIGTEPLAASTGVTFNTGNYSDMRGHGADIKLDVRVLDGSFKWSAELLGSYSTNKVTKYLGSPSTNYNIVIGKPVTGVYALRSAGLDPANGNPRGYLNDTISEDYASLVAQTIQGTNNKFSSSSSWRYEGTSQPTTQVSLRNTFSFHHITVSANVIVKTGYVFTRSTLNYYQLFNYWTANKEFVNRWQKPGDENKTNVPSMPVLSSVDQNRDIFYHQSQAAIVKGNNIKLQDIQVGYDLLKNHLTSLPVNYITIYAYINNVGYIYRANKLGIDPSYPTGGIPIPMSISFGFKVGL